ncbi:DUF2514 family protein [Achromobacter ruhlandii]|uniref:DUF2514 family protein n=1 Tax=Achromobacter ruhlandii TaxID=72557 RepID=UPI000C25A127|nr:DUF2514 family protein [Achromobacter ruhlandii]PJM69201.1 DUF2514 domain-containing protein [Achromobacter ruhlandii]
MSLGSALIGWRGYAAAALAGAVIAGGSAWVIQGWRGDAELAAEVADRALERDSQAQAIITAVEAARKEGRRRIAALEDARDDAQKQADVAAADAAGARAERDRMRAHANTLARAAAGRDPALAAGSPAGAVAVDLLAYMLGRAIDRAEALAAIADRSRIAGLTCELAYDGLSQ